MTDTPPPVVQPECDPSPKSLWWHPATLIAVTITLSIIGFIGANVFGKDSGGTLDRLADQTFARGLITYIFAIGTISTFTTITLVALLSGGPPSQRIRLAKDILSLLLGIFGSILGFYFGSTHEQGPGARLAIRHLAIRGSEGPAGSPGFVDAVIEGGTAPYHYCIVPGFRAINATDLPVVVDTLRLTSRKDSTEALFVVRDANGIVVTKKIFPRGLPK